MCATRLELVEIKLLARRLWDKDQLRQGHQVMAHREGHLIIDQAHKESLRAEGKYLMSSCETFQLI